MTVCIEKTINSLSNESQVVRSLVVIDPQVDNWDVLIAGVNPNSRVILLDSRQDCILQIDRLIKQYPNATSLHLVSHGTPGNLNLGTTNLNLESLGRYRGILSSWENYLQDSSLYIYGCQVASGKHGEDFLQQLHNLTQAKIAASTKVVGNNNDIRNWQLDYCIGDIEPELAFTPATLARYSGTFDPVVSFSTSPDTLVETEGTIFTFNFELSEPPPAGGVVVTIDGNVPESLSQLDLFAIQVEGGNTLEGDFDFSGFSINITEQTATVTAPVFLDDDSIDAIVNDSDPLTPDDFTVTYSLQAGNGYEISPDQNSGTVSFFDTPEDVTVEPTPEPEPEDITVSIAVDNNTLIESEGTEVTITLSLDTPPPADGLIADIGSGEEFSLGDFDVLPPAPQATFTGGALVQGFEDNSGFSFRVDEQTATITLPVFDDGDLPSDNPDATRNDDVGVETVTYSILESEDYNINSESGSITLTLADNPSQLESGGGGNEGNNEDGEVTVYRFFEPTIGSHLYTSSEIERDSIRDNLSNYNFEGPSYKALDALTGEEQANNDNIANAYRFFNPTTGAHLYTTSEIERDSIIENLTDFTFEGEQFAVYNTDIGEETIPVHRFFDPSLGVHFYTPSEGERQNVEDNLPNYEYEGIAYYAIDLDA